MMKKVIGVIPLAYYTIELRFDGEEIRLFDVKPFLDIVLFK